MLHDRILTTMKHIKRFSTFLCSMVNIQEQHPSKHNRILLNFTECVQHISEALNKKNPGSIEMTGVGLHYHTFPFEQYCATVVLQFFLCYSMSFGTSPCTHL